MIFAVSTAGRCGTTITEESSRSVFVLRRERTSSGELLVPFAARTGGELAAIGVGVFRGDIDFGITM